MCLAIPGKIINIDKNKAKVDFGGVTKNISLYFLDSYNEGDYVLVHAGFAIQKVDKESGQLMQKKMGIID